MLVALINMALLPLVLNVSIHSFCYISRCKFIFFLRAYGYIFIIELSKITIIGKEQFKFVLSPVFTIRVSNTAFFLSAFYEAEAIRNEAT
jgi:hypothetical protein